MLDKKNNDPYYLLGRYVAVVERSNNERFNASQMYNIQQATVNLTSYDRYPSRLPEERQEILFKIGADGFPEKVHGDGGKFWIGYYHQKNELYVVENVEHHTPERIAPIGDNRHEELRDERPATAN